MIGYLRFLAGRLRACLDPAAHPYERTVCLWAFHVRLVFILVPAIAWWSATAWLPERFGVLGAAWRLYCAWGAGWLGAFAWADLGLEERFRELLVGCAVNPNLFPTCTLEAYGGFKRGGYPDDERNERLFHRTKWAAHLPWEQSGQPRYDFTAEASTWAQRAHWRWIRPRLQRLGVPGY